MKIGSLVELVVEFREDVKRRYPGVTFPSKGVIYTVRAVCQYNVTALKLEEIVNKSRKYANGYGEPGFDIINFRELQPPMELPEELFNYSPKTVTT